MEPKDSIHIINLRAFDFSLDPRGVVLVKVKANLSLDENDAKDYIAVASTIRDFIGMKVPGIVEVAGFTSLDSGAKAVFRAYNFGDVYYAKAIHAVKSHHRALITFMIKLIGNQQYPIRVFGDTSKALDWLLMETRNSAMSTIDMEVIDHNELVEAVRNRSIPEVLA